jgi:hypothetical protein
LIVSRKDQSNKVKISPLTNHRNTKKGAIKGGFHRTAFFENAEKGFDRLFGYNRQLPETFEYCNTMKNGSITEKLQMQEREIHQQSEKKRDIAPNKHILKPDFSTRQQQASASINHSNTIDAVASLFSILPSAADIAFSNNPEDEQPLRRPKKKKKGRRIGQ